MAPALPDTTRNPFDNALLQTEKLDSLRRRALVPVDNLDIPMDDEDMGLQTQNNLVKDSQEMEQMLVDLGSTDLAQVDLLQAIKTLESGGDNLSTGDTDAIFPLTGFDLADTIGDSEGDATEEKIKQMQVRLERRCAFLKRRLRILQARAIGKRISEEVAQTYEKCVRGARKDGSGRAMGLKGLLKRIETTSTLQASAAARTIIGPKYYHAGKSKGDVSKSATIGIPSGTLSGLEDTAGALRSHLTIVKQELDSDATLSSSGAESNDEAITYNNVHQQPMPIEKRALWSWQRARASIASRWSWLQAQIQELDYKVRQHTELQKQVRASKGAIELEGSPAAYEGPLPGAECGELGDEDPALETCARTRPLRRDTFKKRKLLQMHGLHTATAKAAKPAEVRCGCAWPVEGCAVCTARRVSCEPRRAAAAAALPHIHPILSDAKDVGAAGHLSALCSRAWFRSRCARAAPPPRRRHVAATAAAATPRPPLKRGRPPSKKVKEHKAKDRGSKDTRDDDVAPTAIQENEFRRAARRGPYRASSSFDIDNIVIPASMAATTRVTIPAYKQIDTPKWRVLELSDLPLNGSGHMSDSEEEDVSEAAVAARHQRGLCAERRRFPPVPARRHDKPALPSVHTTNTTGEQHTTHAPTTPAVRPYSPRQFPLRSDSPIRLPTSPHSATSPTLSANSPSAIMEDFDDDEDWAPTTTRQRTTCR